MAKSKAKANVNAEQSLADEGVNHPQHNNWFGDMSPKQTPPHPFSDGYWSMTQTQQRASSHAISQTAVSMVLNQIAKSHDPKAALKEVIASLLQAL